MSTGGQTPFDRQRRAFGEVAELYDRARPSLPESVIDALIAAGGLRARDRVVEVGAGTGIATATLARRGLRVLALEPSAEMARLARANCVAYPGVEVVETDFEHWAPPGASAAVVSVQAWHWIAPAERYRLAAAALDDGGLLAAIWTFPDWHSCTIRDQLSDAYRLQVPGMAPDFPMHPDSASTRLAGDWDAEIPASGLFLRPSVRSWGWSKRYDGVAYGRLLRTHQDHILLPAGQREALLREIEERVDRAGGTFALPLVTYLCIAFRA